MGSLMQTNIFKYYRLDLDEVFSFYITKRFRKRAALHIYIYMEF